MSEGTWTIEAREYSIFGLAGHNYWVLKDPNGQIYSEMHGLATDASGQIVPVGSSSDTLRFYEFSSEVLGFTGDPNGNTGLSGLYRADQASQIAWAGTEAVVMDIWNHGVDAGSRINELGVTYALFGGSDGDFTTGNSNSVAFTIAEAMAVAFPDITYRFNPGDLKNLIPANEQNLYRYNYYPDGTPIPPNSFYIPDGIWTADDVASAAGISVQDLQAANPGVDLNSLVAGQTLNLPAADNSLLTVTTDTDPGSITQEGAEDLTATANSITLGFLRSDATGLVSMPADMINDPSTGDAAALASSQIVADGIRVGNVNLAEGLFEFVTPHESTLLSGPEFELHASLLNITTDLSFDVAYTDPLVLDLNGDGVQLTDYATQPVLFDSDHDGGSLEITGWVSAQDGIVVHDLNGDGVINDMSETLSEYYNGTVGTGGDPGSQPFANGFAALASLDSNLDGKFDSADTLFATLRVWVDANSDGKTDAGELKTFSELGITQINLANTAQSGEVRDGNEVLASGTFVQSGQTKEALAANFLANPNGHTFTASGTGTIVNTQGGVTSYVTQSATGEVMDAAVKGVANLYGAQGSDTLIGDANNNWLAGGPGSDTFNAGAGDDVLLIDGSDLQANIHAGAGLDIVHVVGDNGVTLNLAQAEVEIAEGGRGNDILIGGGRSNVFIRGGEGDDVIIGGAANDALSGEEGNDLVDGGAGNDLIRGHRGRDLLLGGAGDDILDGGLDDDEVRGGDGNDIVKGGQGDDRLDGGTGTDIAEYTGSYADYRITRTDKGIWVADTKSGRDGTDFVAGIEKLNFGDVSAIDLTLPNPMPVKDALAVSFAHGSSTPYLITAASLLGNDIDYQGDALHITTLSDIVGGSATLTGGDVLFTPDAAYTGIMGFKYKVADSQDNPGATVNLIGTGQSAEMKAAVYLRTTDMPTDPLATDEWYLSDTNILPVWVPARRFRRRKERHGVCLSYMRPFLGRAEQRARLRELTRWRTTRNRLGSPRMRSAHLRVPCIGLCKRCTNLDTSEVSQFGNR